MKDQTKFCFRTLGQAVCQTLLLLALAASWLPPAKGQVVIVANLAPRKMRGIESNGMILMAEDAGGKLHFINPEQDINPGAGVS